MKNNTRHPATLHHKKLEKLYAQQMGRRLRQRRQELGYSLQSLAAAVGVSYQQVQKWEQGANRISAPQLKVLCVYLDVSSGYFLDSHPTTYSSLRFEEVGLVETYRNLPSIWQEHLKAVFALLQDAIPH